jgi:glucose-1-phosphate cytidylyltransferase
MKNSDIPVVILCGGSGTRLREQTEFLPKPMIPIGGKPMLVHIMKWYASFGFTRFVLALGYKQEVVKNYFIHYHEINGDVHINRLGTCQRNRKDMWDITMVDTGENTLKGGRLKQVERYIESDIFMCTYGDGIGDIPINSLLTFHEAHGKMVTVTGVIHPPRFGSIERVGSFVTCFREKQRDDDNLINAGFFVFNRKIFDFLKPDGDLEIGVLDKIAESQQMMVYEHKGYWGCMDNMSDLGNLQNIWNSGKAKWRVD